MIAPRDAETRSVALDETRALGQTTTGLSARAAAALAYAAWWVTGILFLAVEQQNAFVRHHARQAVVVFGLLWIVGVALWALSFVGVFLSPAFFWTISVLAHVTWILGIVLWIVCLAQAARGRWWSVPLVSGRPIRRSTGQRPGRSAPLD